jgi:hypothetical protein
VVTRLEIGVTVGNARYSPLIVPSEAGERGKVCVQSAAVHPQLLFGRDAGLGKGGERGGQPEHAFVELAAIH